MRLVEPTGVGECSATSAAATSTVKTGDDGASGGAVVVVGVKLDARSRELLTWALVKVAQSGDRVIALHVLDPTTGKEGKASLLSLVKTFDSVLAAYEGFCNLKQVDLKLKVCRGSPVRKVLAQEVKSCGATRLIVGSSVAHHTIRSRTSVAKYCAKNLQKNISVISVNNGKIMFQREATALVGPESKSKQRKTMGKSPLSLPPERVLSSASSENECDSMALVPFKTQEMPESRSGWTLLQRVFFHNGKVPETPSPKKSSVMQWMLKLPSRQSVTAIYPDQKHINASDKDECHCTDLDAEKGAIMPYGTTSVSDFSKTASRELECLGLKYSSTCRIFSYQELLLATNSFTAENWIGKGGSSRVYRGCLPEGKELAVKILKPSEDVLENFVSEIEIITSLHHSNIISLVGICFEENNLLLVYNLLSRGSLEDNLHGPKKTGNSFCWEDRYKVALGIAEALDYLHNAAVEPVIHRDVKSSNILLSDAFEPQLSDFGLATWASSSSRHIDTTDVAGTFGYLAPEYIMHGKLNENIDVYAFGVVLLELLSGRKPIDNELPKGEESLVMWANRVMKDGKISQLLDPDLTNAYDYNQFEKMVLAAILCIRRAPQSRPQISLILKLLQGDPEVLDWATDQVNASEEVDSVDGEQSGTNLQSFINLALLNLEEGSGSSSSTEQNILVEDYLRGRWSRSSSFD